MGPHDPSPASLHAERHGVKNLWISDTKSDAEQGSLDPGGSLPAPNQVSERTVIWECEERHALVGLPTIEQLERGETSPGIVSAPDGIAFTEDVYRRQPFRYAGCSALAVIRETGSDTTRDVDLLLVGAALGLALSFIGTGVAKLFDP
jgi:hypothetical protein